MLQDLIFNLVGGLGIFIFGMRAMSEALQVLAGHRLRTVIGAVTDNRVLGLGTGLLVTMIVQSSSVTTVMVVSFVNAGLMTLFQAASVILGANIGTTVTGWILVLKLHKSALLFLGAGVFTQMVTSRETPKFLGQFTMGFGMVFFGLSLMQSGFAPLKDLPEFTSWLAAFGSGSLPDLLMSVLIGTVLTVLVQSSSAMLGITIAMATVGLLTFPGAAALVLGENIGTTITAQLAAINATNDGRRAAMFHSLVNILGVAVMIAIFPLWIEGVNAITPGNPELVGPAGNRPYMTAHIAVAHTSFNVMLALITLPLIRQVIRLASLVVRDGGKQRANLKFLHPSMIESPALAIEQGRHEVFHMGEVAGEALHLTRQLYSDMSRGRNDLRDDILKKEKVTDSIQHEITVFMSHVMGGVLTTSQTDEIRNLIRLANEIESVADYCERMANYRRRMLREGVVLTDVAMQGIQSYMDRTLAFYEEIVDRAKHGEADWMLAIQTEGKYLHDAADNLRDENLRRLSTQECDPTAGIFFNDILVAMRRIRNHSFNMAEAFLGLK